MSDFLPEDYSTPKPPSNYMKFEEGENQFRVISSAITGYVWFEDTKEGGRTPKRVKRFEDVPSKYKNTDNRREAAKHFWAFVVYNYKEESIQILELKQATIQRQIEALVKNPKWGSPKEYDIVITKKKTGSQDFDIEYTVLPDPKSSIDKNILKVYQDMKINLQALYEGKDPFNSEADVDPSEIPDDLGE